jgi:hypothetical protein
MPNGVAAMRLRRTLGIVVVPVLLGTAVTAVAVSLPARAATHQSWQDTALSATAVSDETFGGTNLKFTGGTSVIYLSGNDVTWSLGTNFSGVSVTNTGPGSATMSYSGSNTGNNSSIYIDATDSNGNAEAFEMQMYLTPGSIGFNGHTTLETVSDLADANTDNTVAFSDHNDSGDRESFAGDFTVSNLPAGLTSEDPLTYAGMTAAPGTYPGIVVTAKAPDGVAIKGTFTLTVSARSINTYGNYVNKFGKGFDVFRHKAFPGAKIVSWAATRSDQGTHFIINVGTHPGAYQIEYAPHGTGSGLCVSDPGGGVPSDPLRDGLILVHCGSGNWQQFIRLSNGALKNWATGLYVNPGGAGAQLRGESSARAGSSYTWRAESSLP